MIFFGSYNFRNALKQQAWDDRRWRDEDIVKTRIVHGHFTKPGREIRVPIPFEIECTVFESGVMPIYTETTFAFAQAQEFKTIRYENHFEDHYNRRSGRYLYSTLRVRRDDGKSYTEYCTLSESAPALTETEIKEQQR